MDLTRNTPSTSGVGFYDGQKHLIALVLSLEAGSLSDKDAEGLSLLGLSWQEAKKRRSGSECKRHLCFNHVLLRVA